VALGGIQSLSCGKTVVGWYVQRGKNGGGGGGGGGGGVFGVYIIPWGGRYGGTIIGGRGWYVQSGKNGGGGEGGEGGMF